MVRKLTEASKTNNTERPGTLVSVHHFISQIKGYLCIDFFLNVSKHADLYKVDRNLDPTTVLISLGTVSPICICFVKALSVVHLVTQDND